MDTNDSDVASNPRKKTIYKQLVVQMRNRTYEHIRRVLMNGLYLSNYIQDRIDINIFKEIIRSHDRTKFKSSNIHGYVLMTDKYQNGTKYSTTDNKIMDKAWRDHYLNERHHPEYWLENYNTVTTMPLLYLAEMVCDWHAMSQELKNSTTEWYLRVSTSNGIQSPKYCFSDEQKEFIESCIEVLEKYTLIENQELH